MLRAHLVHLTAWALLRGTTPERAARWLGHVAERLEPLSDERLSELLAKLRGGTCLSRAMTAAAFHSGAEVVIGVPPPGRADWSAHAWVELGGKPVPGAEVQGAPIARFSVRRGGG